MHIGDMIYEKNKAIWMNIREMEEQDRPREKLERKGPESLSDLELVMLLVSSGTLDRSVNEISGELLDLLDRDEDPDLDRICAIRGMGKAKGTTVLAALELGRRRLRKMGVGAMRKAAREGDEQNGSFMCGQIAGLVNKEQPAAEIIREMFAQAEELLKGAAQWVR